MSVEQPGCNSGSGVAHGPMVTHPADAIAARAG